MGISHAGSITRAAEQLGVPRATLSRRLTQLEEAIGSPLFLRRARGVHLTSVGQALIEEASAWVDHTDRLWEVAKEQQRALTGRLTVTVPPGAEFLHPFFIRFGEQHPEVELDVRVVARHVDLAAEGMDVALRFGPAHDSDLIRRPFWSYDLRAVASPAYLDARGVPMELADLAMHECLTLVSTDGAPIPWPGSDGRSHGMAGALRTNDIGLLVSATLAGRGVAVLAKQAIQHHLDRGDLRVVLPDQIGASLEGHILTTQRARSRAALDVFCEALIAYLAREHPVL